MTPGAVAVDEKAQAAAAVLQVSFEDVETASLIRGEQGKRLAEPRVVLGEVARA